MRKRYRRAAVALSAVALLAAACDSSASGGGDSGSGPIRIALMGIITGPSHLDGWDNSFKLAVDEINAAGGVLGRQIEYKEFDSGITPQAAADATNLAVEYQPNLIIGYSVSAGLKASIPGINAAGVPVIHNTLAKLTSPDSLGSQLTFRLSPTGNQYATASYQYLTQKAGARSIALVNTQDASPAEGAGEFQAEAAKGGVRVEHRAVSPTVTDLTEPVLAAKGSDALFVWGYNETDALAVKTAAANGYQGQYLGFNTAAAAQNNLIPAGLLTDKVHAMSFCPLEVLDTPAAQKYQQAYTAKYGVPPGNSSTSSYYDAVYIFKNVAEQIKSVDPGQIVAGLAKVDYQGACGEEKADAQHNLSHSVSILSFAGGKQKVDSTMNNLDAGF
ncbi:ABC transporter substrate-binding protein [Amycolatopsis sp. GM8]|uniref:ABC transporter substrate-binding protein n=1 Tax=Amycolatopsis sp. GM8 TaxID=2896530 RepID=UPI001F35EBE0|nr:ABC transporter substrate-binding protein [Amycolatopsis sp. GM8]